MTVRYNVRFAAHNLLAVMLDNVREWQCGTREWCPLTAAIAAAAVTPVTIEGHFWQ